MLQETVLHQVRVLSQMASILPEAPSLLQEQCLQYLIDHLEDIPVEALALLPTAIRHTLAVHLPVADILQLEQTRFASGLDMPGVWKEVCEIRHLLSRYPKLKEMFESEIEAKEFVITVVAYEVFHHQQEKPHNFQAKQLFFHHREEMPQPCIPGPPVFFSRISIETPCKVPKYAVPSRFFTMHENRFDGGILKLLSTKYYIYPERLYIDCRYCVGVTNMVLCRLKQLSVSCMVYEEFQCSYVRSLLSGCSQCLHTISLHDCCDEEINEIVSTVVSVFTNSPANFQSLRHFHVAVYRASAKRRHGCGTGQKAAMTECKLKKALTTLCKAIQTHTSLHSCSLRQWSGINGQDIVGSILSLFKQPQFHCLTLTDTYLSLESIQHLVHTFLTTPCSGPQILKLEGICIYGRDHTDRTALSICDSSFLLHKSLVLDCHNIILNLYPSSGVKSSLKKWLSTLCKLQLHSLTVTK